MNKDNKTLAYLTFINDINSDEEYKERLIKSRADYDNSFSFVSATLVKKINNPIINDGINGLQLVVDIN